MVLFTQSADVCPYSDLCPVGAENNSSLSEDILKLSQSHPDISSFFFTAHAAFRHISLRWTLMGQAENMQQEWKVTLSHQVHSSEFLW